MKWNVLRKRHTVVRIKIPLENPMCSASFKEICQLDYKISCAQGTFMLGVWKSLKASGNVAYYSKTVCVMSTIFVDAWNIGQTERSKLTLKPGSETVSVQTIS